MLSAYATIGALALAGSLVSAQAQGTADPLQIALVEAQFNASGLDTPIGNSQALNIPLEAEGLLNVTYSNFTVQNGMAYPAGQVNTKPRLTVVPAEGAAWSGNYTVILADFSALGNPDAEGDYRHYLANNVQASSVGLLSNGTVITYYAGPGPIEGTGAHRYSWLIFQQPSTFTAPANLSTSGVAPGHWSVQNYVQSSGLGKLVAASFFTVENGAPTASAVSTTAVNTATLSIPSSATSSGAATQGANSNANTNKDKDGAASSSYAISGIAAFAVAGLVAVLA